MIHINHKNKIIIHIAKIILCFAFLCIVTSSAKAIILYSGDNTNNLTAPDTARTDIFNSVAKITDENGTGIIGSAVHIKDKYLLTAEHVLYKNATPRRTHVSFDGTSYFAIDLNFLPIQIDSADLVLFKLIKNPNLPETQLYTSTNELNKTGTLIGWGYGRDSNQADQTSTTRTWTWGIGSTINKRWGTNQIANTGNAEISGNIYDFLQTRLNSNQGASEAAFAYYDSGSGLYISNSGTWQLAGITTAVTTFGSSTFANFTGSQDSNYFVRISQYQQNILNNIPDTSTYPGWAIDNSLYGTDAETTADPDDDGLDNQTEFNLGSDPNDNDTSNDGLSDQALVDYGLDPNVDHTLLYNAIVQSIADLREGSTIIEVINNQATITLNLESSDNLMSSWTETGETATLQIPTSNDTKFYRFKLSY